MRTNRLFSVMPLHGAGNSFFQKMLVSALILALLFAALPAGAALAAPASDGTSVNISEMQKEWDNKIEKVEYNSMFYQRVRVYPADFEDLDELTVANDILNNYGVAMRAAQRIVFNHSGFDLKGKVINERLAYQSLKDLSENLRLMRVYKEQLDRLDGDYRLLPLRALTTTTSQ